MLQASPVLDDLAAVAARIQAAVAAGEVCPLVGRVASVRILRTARLVDAGQMLPVKGRFLAMEAEALAMAIAPLPAPPRAGGGNAKARIR
ncbi:hypothetical protein [Methylobacterium sp. MA0201]|uniref:hypothetical protein n=1 Tax=Methylobacterium alsaeris TaxID=3344826 RepID=UPI0037584291